ncbi:leucine-rich repeat serine/threonine-protein kinase 2 isoform X1 [Hydra vulgaris]|uniref:leucine-rich repeat serine/threonine-protein kinase 2 isoform X1 n=2 Tax=Hydra vulgaris TaxID=6087 RepID=UPI0032EA22EE
MVGFLEKIRKKNNEKDEETLKSNLNVRSGPLGYTSLHEAVFSKKPDNVKRILDYGADINSMSDGRYTPLHIAASIDACTCIEVLLKYNANTELCDENNKTPYETAVCNSCVNSARLLLSHDILTCLKQRRNHDFLKYLKTVDFESVTPDCFDKCLNLAVEEDNYVVIGIILIRKPRYAKECLIDALKKPNFSKSTLILLLCYAVEKHFNDVIKVIFENKDVELDKNQLFKCDIHISAETLRHLKSFVSNDKVFAYPISIGCNHMVKNFKGVEYMLLSLFCDKKNLKADWRGLLLRFLHEDWFKGLTSYKDVILSHNKIKSISPTNILNCLGAVEKLNLSSNKLQDVPSELFKLPKLRILNLSSNQLRHLPNVKEWSLFLTTLSLEKNLLESFPLHVEGLKLKHLYLADNRLKSVPKSICNLKCLETLDISRNVDIHSLPVSMGKLSKLTQLDLDGLEIEDPPPEYKKPKEILNYLKGKLRHSKAYYKMKLMIIGFPQQGKTTLLKRLKDDTNYNVDQSTHGIDIEEITISLSRKDFNFRVWDFAGQEEYFATHQCFLSSSSLYLLVWDVTKKKEYVQLLQPWFENLVARVQFFYIIVVGTKLDLLKNVDIDSACDQMKTEIQTLIETIPAVRSLMNSDKYFSLRLKICFVSLDTKCQSYSKDIDKLKTEIYLLAETMTYDGKQNGEKIMGKLFPQIYIKLEEKINEIKKQKENNSEVPIISREEFISLAKSLKCDNDDIFQDDDLEPATKFLMNTGTILHFDGANEGLRDIIFINPSWICKLMSKFITVDAVHTFVKNGILEKDKIPLILKKELGNENPDLIKKCISLLSRFQVACKIDDHRVLIPPKLPSYDPKYGLLIKSNSLLTRYYFFSCIPNGFWARFITRFLSMTKEMLSPKPNTETKPKVSIVRNDLPKDELDAVMSYCKDEKPPKINETNLSNILYVITSPKTNSTLNQIHFSQQLSRNIEPSINNPSVFNNVDNLVCCLPIKCFPNNSETSNDSKNSNSSSSSSSTVSAESFFNSDAKALYHSSSSCNSSINKKLNSICSKKVPSNSHNECVTFMSTTGIVIDNDTSNDFDNDINKFVINPNNYDNNSEHKDFNTGINKNYLNNVNKDIYNDFIDGTNNSINNSINADLSKDITSYVINDVNYSINNGVYNDFNDGINNDVNNDLNNSNYNCADNGINNGINNDVNKMVNEILPAVDSCFNHVNENNNFIQHLSDVMIISKEFQDCVIHKFETNSNEELTSDGIVKKGINIVVAANENQNETKNINLTNSQSDCMVDVELNFDQNCNISNNSGVNNELNNNINNFVTNAINYNINNGAFKEELQSCTIPYLETNKNEVIACNGIVKIETNLVVAANENQYEGKNTNFTDSQSDSVIRAELNSDQNCNISSSSDQNCNISNNCGSSFKQVGEQSCDPPTIVNELINVNPSDCNCNDGNCSNDEIPKQTNYNVSSNVKDIPISDSHIDAHVDGIVFENDDNKNTETDGHMHVATEVDNGYFDASMQIVSKQDCEDYNCTNEEKKEENDELESQLINELSNNDEDYEEHFNDYGELAYLLDNGYLSCWNKGIIFNHPQLCFSIQQLPISFKADRKTIEICVTKSSLGYRVLSYVVDHIRTLLNEWFEGLLMSHKEPHVVSSLACPICTSLGINPPHLFNISTAFQKLYQISENNTCAVFCERKHVPRTINITEFCPDLTFQDLPKTMKFNSNDIQCEQNENCKLGEGQFAKVYSGFCKNKIKAAIKFYKFKMNNLDELSSLLNQFYEIRQEIVMLSKLRHHPYIIQFLGFLLRPELCAVMECAKHGALSSLIYDESKTKVIPRIVKFRICQQIASALAFMHKKYIIHRNIKSDNILLFSLNHNAKINIKLTDFGTANFMSPSGLKTFFGTKGYAAPEIILHKMFLDEYTSSVDIYSFGMVIYELIAYKRPFYHVEALHIDNEVTSGSRPSFDNILDASYGLVNLTKLMITMWHQEPSKRPPANDILNMLSPAFQLVFGFKMLDSTENPRDWCYISSCNTLWITCDDKKAQYIIVINMERFEIVKKIELKAKDFELENFNMSSITPIGDKHVCVVLRSLNDILLICKAKDYSFKTHKIEDGYICSISANKDWVCLGFDDGRCSKIKIKTFLNGKLKTFHNFKLKESFPVTTSVLSSESFIWSAGCSFIHCNLKKNDEEKIRDDTERNVKEIVLSFDEKLFFVSYQSSPAIHIYSTETKEVIHKFSCQDDILKYSPEALNVDLRVTCMCSVNNMLWVGTGSGHILIYEVRDVGRIYKLLQALHPYAIEMRKLLLVVLTQARQDGVKYLIVSIGKELNKNAFGFSSVFEFNGYVPKDQTAKDEKRLDNGCNGGNNGKVIIVWHVLESHQYENLIL